MKKRIIIGFLGEDKLCKQSANVLKNGGFHIASIESKVKEISKHLIKNNEEISEELIYQIRGRGYRVNHLYWINLLLASISEKHNLIVIPDLFLEDIVEKVIDPYYISSDTVDSIQELPSNIEAIKVVNTSELKKIIENKFKHVLQNPLKKI